MGDEGLQGSETAKLHHKVQRQQSFITSADAKLSSESVKGAPLPLEGIDHVHGSHSLPLGMLSVGDGIPDDILQEDLEQTQVVNRKVPNIQLP